jgi:hypothetical protein
MFLMLPMDHYFPDILTLPYKAVLKLNVIITLDIKKRIDTQPKPFQKSM